MSTGDVFYKLFLGDFCTNPACCRNCKYKYNNSSADIRIGDMWGKTYADNEDGVSAVAVYTETGKQVISDLDCVRKEYPFDIIAEGQLKQRSKLPAIHGFIMDGLKDDAVELSILARYAEYYNVLKKWLFRITHPYNIVRNFCRRFK